MNARRKIEAAMAFVGGQHASANGHSHDVGELRGPIRGRLGLPHGSPKLTGFVHGEFCHALDANVGRLL